MILSYRSYIRYIFSLPHRAKYLRSQRFCGSARDLLLVAGAPFAARIRQRERETERERESRESRRQLPLKGMLRMTHISTISTVHLWVHSFQHIHAAPRQGPPAPRSQGVISASVVVNYFMANSSKNLVFSAIFVPSEEQMLVFTMFLQHPAQN